jgi:hypothetical protein
MPEAKKPETVEESSQEEVKKTPKEGKKSRPKVGPDGKRVKGAPRGPARPHRRIEQEVLDSRIEKLQKRIKRARLQLEVSERHVSGYLFERQYRLGKDA